MRGGGDAPQLWAWSTRSPHLAVRTGPLSSATELAHIPERGERAGHLLEIVLTLSWEAPDSHSVRKPKCGEEGEAAGGIKATWSGSSLRGKEGWWGVC